jgi:hypothetical protein
VRLGDLGAKLELGAGDVFRGNGEQDRLGDGQLAVPDTALP